MEDKLLQSAVSLILQAIYEQDLQSFSYGYRLGTGAGDAVEELSRLLQFGKTGYVVEADIKGFFEHIDHDWLIRMLEQRVDDRAFLQLIGKWLKAGVLAENGDVIKPEAGTPQGGSVSPVLANVYFGVRCNFQRLNNFYHQVRKILHKWLNKRSQRRSCNWSKFIRLAQLYRLERPRIVTKPPRQELLFPLC